MRKLIGSADPRHSLAAGVMWLIIALALSFSVAAAIWVGHIARQNVIEQHVRRLALETDLLASELEQALASRLAAVHAASLPVAPQPAALNELMGQLQSAYPSLDWIAFADPHGVIVASSGAARLGSSASGSAWFREGLHQLWIGVIEEAAVAPGALAPGAVNGITGLGDMAVAIRDAGGTIIGVVAAHLSWRRTVNQPRRLTEDSDPRSAAQAFILDLEGNVLVGPDGMRGKPWGGVVTGREAPVLPAGWVLQRANGVPQFERLPNGTDILVSREILTAPQGTSARGWLLQLGEPYERVYKRADLLARQILWVSLCLGALTSLLGVLGARHLTKRLKRLAHSVAAVGHDELAQVEAPAGMDEVAQLGSAFAKILGELRRERAELERRVAVRTREVERLAEESRYAAIVRERLQIARDLHDTLAHSMMAILSEIRLLRKLQARDPAAVTAELAHAEDVAQEGLNEARAAITQMRLHAVRETGLGPALSNVFQRFIDRTGMAGTFSADLEAARFGDERGETLLRMAQEMLRNIERHSRATRVTLQLRITDGTHLELHIVDNGVGFDPQAIPPEHYGIIGLREQAELIGADLLIESTSNHGTKLSVLLRLSPEAFSRQL